METEADRARIPRSYARAPVRTLEQTRGRFRCGTIASRRSSLRFRFPLHLGKCNVDYSDARATTSAVFCVDPAVCS